MNEYDLTKIKDYYSSKIIEHGPSNRGVDWSSLESQVLRFAQLIKVIKAEEEFTITDIGCGYGALLQYLMQFFKNFSYVGYDISEEMIAVARNKFSLQKNVDFILADRPQQQSDYLIASGIFNVMLDNDPIAWKHYFFQMLDIFHKSSKLGFAFNCLTTFSDVDRQRPDLFYVDPGEVFNYCKRNFSKNVALLHDYDLYEFTILVRK